MEFLIIISALLYILAFALGFFLGQNRKPRAKAAKKQKKENSDEYEGLNRDTLDFLYFDGN